MEKFIIRAEDFGKLYRLCEEMHPAADIIPEGKVAEYLNQFSDNATTLAEEVSEMENKVDIATGELIDREISSALDKFTDAATTLKSINDWSNALYDNLSNALAALRELVAPDGWAPVRNGDEINEALKNTEELTNSISIGYKNYCYAILFENENGGDEFVSEPFIFAVGREEDLAAVTRYFESFFDLDDKE